MPESNSFPVGIEFDSILRAISKQIYETPLAFIRENVQNAIDAIRIQALRDGADPASNNYWILVTVEGQEIRVQDNGIGMSLEELRNFFWTIGASGKRTPEAARAGCVGMFGIGGFANFGVCDSVEVTSQTGPTPQGTQTRLTQAAIKSSPGIPSVEFAACDDAAPRGTIVAGHLRETPDLEVLRVYLRDFVKFVPTAVRFNNEVLSQSRFSGVGDRENLTPLSEQVQDWQLGDLVISGRLYEDRGHTVVVDIRRLVEGGKAINLVGQVRFEHGAIDAFKRGFKLCATQVPSIMGFSGRIDCDRFVPTAGRDSLDSTTTSLLGRIASALERAAVDAVLAAPERINENVRVFKYVLQHGLVNKLDNAIVKLADGSEDSLGNIRRRSVLGTSVFFGVAQKQALNQIMQARGHIVVLLSSDSHRQLAERQFLQVHCAAKAFDGVIECNPLYDDISRFERVFLSELEESIARSYEIKDFRVVAGKLTEDIPVFVKEQVGNSPLEIFVDVRHEEIAKLEGLGFTPLLYSLITRFSREYLGSSLKKWSPRFFGDGALNLEQLYKSRSELWTLLKDDIEIVDKGERQVFTGSDVHVVNVGAPTPPRNPRPRLLRVVDAQKTTGLAGFYLRLPDAAYRAYGDLLPECENRGVVWAGNRIVFVASDAISASFQYEIRVDEVVAADFDGGLRAEGALPLDRQFQEMYEGIYFPIPNLLERFIVPQGVAQIRLELRCDWIDIRTAKHWKPSDAQPGLQPV